MYVAALILAAFSGALVHFAIKAKKRRRPKSTKVLKILTFVVINALLVISILVLLDPHTWHETVTAKISPTSMEMSTISKGWFLIAGIMASLGFGTMLGLAYRDETSMD